MTARFFALTTVAVVGFGALGATANAASPLYVSGSFGGYFRENISGPDTFFNNANPDATVPGTDKLGFNSGFIGNFALGYKVLPQVRLEAEFGYSTYTGSTLNPYTSSPNFPALNGQTFSHRSGDRYLRYMGTFNAFYDFKPLAGRYTPYVGVGVGDSADHRTEGLFTSSSGQVFRSGGGGSSEGLGLVEGGFNIALTNHWSIVPAYRYIHYFSSKEDVAHVAKIGVRYTF